MSFEFIQNLLKEAVSMGCDGVRFTGGEVLTRQDFIQIYLCAHNLGLRVSIATNITLVTDEIADVFVKCQPEKISISIYGWDSLSYDSVVNVPHSFEKFVAGIEKLRTRNLSFSLKYPPTKFLVQNSDKLNNMAQRLGVSEQLPFAWELTMPSRHDLLACQRIQSCRLTPKEAAVQRLKEHGVKEQDKQAILSGKKRFTNRIFACRGARRRLTVDPNGQLQVCLEVRHPDTVYDLNVGSLKDAVENHLPTCRKMRFSKPEYMNRCGRCRLRPACPLCPACSWMENGDLESPSEYHCEVMHAEAQILGLIKEGEKGWE